MPTATRSLLLRSVQKEWADADEGIGDNPVDETLMDLHRIRSGVKLVNVWTIPQMMKSLMLSERPSTMENY